MFKQIFRLTFITLIWKNYKRAIVSTSILFLFFWFVSFAHAEYLAFSELQTQPNNVSLSFFIKWFCLIAGFILYWVYISWKPKKTVSQPGELKDEGDDPFEAIRHKKTLRTRAEIMLEKNDIKSGNNKRK